jgi:hypothetical protein
LRQGKYGTRHLTAGEEVELSDKPKRVARKVRRVKR